MSISVNVNLVRWLEGDCQYRGCGFNSNGYCECDDFELSDKIINIIRELYEDEKYNLDDVKFSCDNISFIDDCCIYCGNYLEEYTEQHPYGDTYATEHLIGCKYCK